MPINTAQDTACLVEISANGANPLSQPLGLKTLMLAWGRHQGRETGVIRTYLSSEHSIGCRDGKSCPTSVNPTEIARRSGVNGPEPRPLKLSFGNAQPGTIVLMAGGRRPSRPEPVSRPQYPRNLRLEPRSDRWLLIIFRPPRNLLERAGFKVHNHSSLHMQMAGRNTWCHPTRERGLEQCFPALKYVTCLQSLPWPKS
jgi:hypothetical protein